MIAGVYSPPVLSCSVNQLSDAARLERGPSSVPLAKERPAGA